MARMKKATEAQGECCCVRDAEGRVVTICPSCPQMAVSGFAPDPHICGKAKTDHGSGWLADFKRECAAIDAEGGSK